MALAEIGARLRLQGAEAYRRDANRAADATDRLGREARATDRHLGRMGSAARRAGGALSSIGRAGALGGVAAVTVGVGALAAGLFQGFKDAAALQTIMGKTNAVIASTQGVANVSAKSVVNLADSLESLSGVDGDAIINAQNLLLTFTKVRNGVGETNHVFDLATKAAVDMAVALGQDPAAAAMQLGKALNDPVKGVAALGKAGVSFSEDQKKTIKRMVEANRVMDAQKIILGEMRVQFGGAAKAAGAGFEGSMARAKDAIGDLFRDVATPLLPVVTEQLERFSGHVNDKLAPAMITFAEGFRDGTGSGGRFRDKLKEVWTELKEVGRFATDVYGKVKTLVNWMRDNTGVVKTFAVAVVAVKVGMFGLAIVNYTRIALGMAAIGTAASTATGTMTAFGVVLTGLMGPAGAITLAAAAIGGLLLLAGRAEQSAASVANAQAGYPTVTTTKPKPPPKTITLDGVTKPVKPVVEVVPSRPSIGAPPRGNNLVAGQGAVAPIIIHNTTTLDGKVVAESTKRVLQDKAARR